MRLLDLCVRAACSLTIRLGFWDVGLELFASAPAPPFVQADVFELNKETSTPTSEPPADLSKLTSLALLRGHVAAIHATAVFHLFDFDNQEQVARNLAGLLSPLSGSMIFGVHVGMLVRGEWCPTEGNMMHCHSPTSWRELWQSIFAEIGAKVEVNAALEASPELVNTDPYGEGWIVVLEVTDVEDLESQLEQTLDSEGYAKITEG